MVRVAIVEDEKEAVQTLENYLSRYQQLIGESFHVTVFANAVSFLEPYRGFDLVFMDIQLSIFCCVFLLYIRSGVLERSQMEQEAEEPVLPEEMQEMKRLIGIYEAAVKTGNDTLDTILTERSLYCEKEGIRLSCMADGEKLSFMPVGDICALFGNALENAIEAVAKLEQVEDRNISFQVRESRGLLVITVDNYFSGPLTFEDGLPVPFVRSHSAARTACVRLRQNM